MRRSAVTTLILACMTGALPARAGPGTADMIAEKPIHIEAATEVTKSLPFDRFAEADAAQEPAASFADADETLANDSHPMIPLPPGVWVGLIGLVFVARRILRGQPVAVR